MTKMYSTRLDEDVIQEIKTRAEGLGISQGDLIRRLLRGEDGLGSGVSGDVIQQLVSRVSELAEKIENVLQGGGKNFFSENDVRQNVRQDSKQNVNKRGKLDELKDKLKDLGVVKASELGSVDSDVHEDVQEDVQEVVSVDEDEMRIRLESAKNNMGLMRQAWEQWCFENDASVDGDFSIKTDWVKVEPIVRRFFETGSWKKEEVSRFNKYVAKESEFKQIFFDDGTRLADNFKGSAFKEPKKEKKKKY